MSEGFYKRHRGILEHIESGKIDLLAAGIHDFLCLKANLVIGSPCSIPVGVCFTSAPAIHAHCRRVSVRSVQRCLNHLEAIGWLKPWKVRGKRGNYPVLVCRASVHDLSGNEYRINGAKTIDWRHPLFEPVGEVSPKASNSVASLSGYREKRIERKEKRESRAAKQAPPDSRYVPFLEFAKASFETTLKHPPTWECFGKDGAALTAFLRRAPHVTLDIWQAHVLNFFNSTEAFTVKQGGSLAYFVSRFDTFSAGPILEGGSNGKVSSFSERRSQKVASAISTVLDRFEKASGDIHRALPPTHE